MLGEIDKFEFEADVDHHRLTVEGSENTVFSDVPMNFHHTSDSMLQGSHASMVLKRRVVS